MKNLKPGDLKTEVKPDLGLQFLNYENGELFNELIERSSTEQIKKLPALMNIFGLGKVVLDEASSAKCINCWLKFILSIDKQYSKQ